MIENSIYLTLFTYIAINILLLPIIYYTIETYLFETEHIASKYLKKFDKYRFRISLLSSVILVNMSMYQGEKIANMSLGAILLSASFAVFGYFAVKFRLKNIEDSYTAHEEEIAKEKEKQARIDAAFKELNSEK